MKVKEVDVMTSELQLPRLWIVGLAVGLVIVLAARVHAAMYETGSQQTLFDGRWKAQGLSEAAYAKKVETAEQEYSRLLSILAASLKGA